MKELNNRKHELRGGSHGIDRSCDQTPPLSGSSVPLSRRFKREPPYRRNYVNNTIQGSSSLLKVIRAFQPELLSGKERNMVIIKLIEKYVLSDYECDVHASEGYQILKGVLNEDMLIAVKGLRAIAEKDQLNQLKKIDHVVQRDVENFWKDAEPIIKNLERG